MLRKMFVLFIRDMKVNTRDFLTLYILVVPIIFGIVINLVTPSVNDTTVNLALVEGDNPNMVAYLEDFAKVSVYKDAKAIEERVGRRDEVFGIVPDGDGYYILQQGNEPEGLEDFAKLLLVFYEEGITVENSTAVINSFGRTEPPLKKLLVNMAMMFAAILGGMLIAINIIEEKVDNTISAIHLSPLSRTAYIFGKSMMGGLLPVYGSIALLLITGFTDIAWGKMLVLVIVSMVISILFGFIQGINNSTVMDAAGSVKMLFLPMGAAVAVAELVKPAWQWTVYWVPFYWTYKGVDDILNYKAEWGTTFLYAAIVLGISVLVYVLLMPRIRKGLE